MSERAPLVIIGTGLAGYNLAREWRKLDGETPLLMITADDAVPIPSRCSLPASRRTRTPTAWPWPNRAPWRATERAHPDPYPGHRYRSGHQRIWIGEEEVRYRDLVLAWARRSRSVAGRGRCPGRALPINDLEDYARFRQAAAGKRRVLLLGAGLIGCEFANDLSSGGYQLDVVAPCEQVMPGLLHPAAAKAVQAGLEGSRRASTWGRCWPA
ncbi:FAD-dependent oxidoreductase [Pseudomonas aeruginosa]|uniref:FAD-dependent oxidoreductase n=1 Tax=Pseudomonas aeruginosa TaxID=287 RepID=UPI00405384A3